MGGYLRTSNTARGGVLAMTLALLTATVAFAATTTDQADYAPGSVVTISGGNDADGAPGYVPGAQVSVEVTGPNGWPASCLAPVMEGGTWACTITLDTDPAIAVGDYTYTASSTDDAGAPIVETGAFTDANNVDTTLTLSTAASSIVQNVPLGLSGTLTSQNATYPVPSGRTVTVEVWFDDKCNGTADDETTATTGAGGAYAASYATADVGFASFKATFQTSTVGSGSAATSWKKSSSACSTVSVIPPIPLFVVPDAKTITYADPIPTTSFYTYTLHLESSTGTLVTPTLLVDPTCGSAYSTSTSVSASPLAIACSGGSDPSYAFHYVSGALTILPAPISVVVNGGSKQVTAPGSGSATGISFTVDLTATTGDVSTAALGASLVPVGGGSSSMASCTKGTASGLTIRWTCTLASLALGVHEITATASGNYTGTGTDVFAVYDPSLGFATGAGGITLGGERMNFGFVMKYNRNGASPQGNFLAVLHRPDGTTAKLKSNALSWLMIDAGAGCGTATFAGKSTYTWSEGGVESSIGSVPFQVVAKDCDSPGADSLRITASGTLLTMAAAADLLRGTIAVPHKAR